MIGMVMARVFVNNLTNSMMMSRDMRVSPGKRRDQAHKQRGGLACNWRVGESRTNSPGHFNSSRLMKVPPSRDLILFWTRLVDNSSEAFWNVTQLFEFLVGTLLGSHGNYGIPNCGGGGAAARSSLDQGSPESKSLSYAVLREIVLRMDAMPWYRRQRQWKGASSYEGPQNERS
jgi:hypothetical protein